MRIFRFILYSRGVGPKVAMDAVTGYILCIIQKRSLREALC